MVSVIFCQVMLELEPEFSISSISSANTGAVHINVTINSPHANLFEVGVLRVKSGDDLLLFKKSDFRAATGFGSCNMPVSRAMTGLQPLGGGNP